MASSPTTHDGLDAALKKPSDAPLGASGREKTAQSTQQHPTEVQLPWLLRPNESQPSPRQDSKQRKSLTSAKHAGSIDLTALLSLAVALDVLATTTDALEPKATVLSDLAEALVALRENDKNSVGAASTTFSELAQLAEGDDGPVRDRMAAALVSEIRHKQGAPTVLALADPHAVCGAVAHLRALASLLCQKAELAVATYSLHKQLRP